SRLDAYRGTFSHTRRSLSTSTRVAAAESICLASWANGLILKPIYEPHCQLHEFGRTGFDHHPVDHSRFVRCEEATGTRARNGPGSEGVSKGEGRVQRRVEQGREI